VLRYPDATAPPAGSRVEALEQALARRGIRPVTYDVWLRVEEAEAELARSLGRGERVKLHGRAALLAACWPVRDDSAGHGTARDDSAGDDIVSGASVSGDSVG
jgi:hypothetical protein